MKLSDGTCKVCFKNVENMYHLLISCTDIMVIWKQIEIIVKRVLETFKLDNLSILGGYFEDCGEINQINAILSVTRWNIWKRRNVIKYENVNIPVEECLNVVVNDLKCMGIYACMIEEFD